MSVLDDMALIRSGPAIGIVSNEQGVAMQRDTMLEWGECVEAGDKVWIIGEPVDTLAYMYEHIEVAAPTVMSTPTYNEYLLYYWELNPDKYPEVIVVSSYMGELAWEVRSNDWLMNFLEVQYQAEKVVDGVYWKYYIKK